MPFSGDSVASYLSLVTVQHNTSPSTVQRNTIGKPWNDAPRVNVNRDDQMAEAMNKMAASVAAQTAAKARRDIPYRCCVRRILRGAWRSPGLYSFFCSMIRLDGCIGDTCLSFVDVFISIWKTVPISHIVS
uniref:Uncharacterized protein LOC113787621 n=1 Tax=Cicer arietinum TaxID=3827 RepID=A0A3Q7XVE7_CICAR|nr:uncharacterized protein LOC113787621 [Cicer arietinum]